MSSTTPARDAYELRFENLYVAARGYSFPCDAHGRVDMDSLSDRLRESYLYARALMGRETSAPSVRRVA